jgi:hypothetical protein
MRQLVMCLELWNENTKKLTQNKKKEKFVILQKIVKCRNRWRLFDKNEIMRFLNYFFRLPSREKKNRYHKYEFLSSTVGLVTHTHTQLLSLDDGFCHRQYLSLSFVTKRLYTSVFFIEFYISPLLCVCVTKLFFARSLESLATSSLCA